MQPRFTISGLMAVVVFAGVGFAAMRSGSILWLRIVYTVTALVLLVAIIAARYCGAFWFGFSVFGWGYFLLGLGPWVPLANAPYPEGRTLNRMFISTDLADFMGGFQYEFMPEGPRHLAASERSRNIEAICHSMLTPLFAIAGGVIARRFAAHRSNQSPMAKEPER